MAFGIGHLQQGFQKVLVRCTSTTIRFPSPWVARFGPAGYTHLRLLVLTALRRCSPTMRMLAFRLMIFIWAIRRPWTLTGLWKIREWLWMFDWHCFEANDAGAVDAKAAHNVRQRSARRSPRSGVTKI